MCVSSHWQAESAIFTAEALARLHVYVCVCGEGEEMIEIHVAQWSSQAAAPLRESERRRCWMKRLCDLHDASAAMFA